ncbi:hypothetical protein [Zavarzinia aquatilis]|uniref:Uncharacterized protein n=1 Tax=Zavarzinia aquatilis TaxID=2211142 RepID=A0A317EDZ7_9PROT|nr:hypothetical protein [Zavarzinia aquatilis]PWR24486.1 hypothetical protein DKG74_06680 [Zavarzinia aquatilis]
MGFFRPVFFALRQWWSLEALGFALLQAAQDFGLLAATGNLDRLFTDPYFTPMEIDRMQAEATRPMMLVSLVLLPIPVALGSRLNRRLFGRPLPVGPVEGAFRWMKTQILGGLSLLALTAIPFAFVILTTKLVAPGAIDPIGATAGAIAVLAAVVLAIAHAFYPIRVMYKGWSSFAAARRLSRGHRWTLVGRVLALVVAILAICIVFMLPALIINDSRGLFLITHIALSPLAAAATAPCIALWSSLYFEAEAAAA